MLRRLWILAIVVLLAACNAAPSVTPTPPPVVPGLDAPKRLATVFMSPTPNEAERQATRLAVSPTPRVSAALTPTPTPTVYIGVFLGASSINAPVFDPDGIDIEGVPTITPVPSRCPLTPDVDTLGERWQSDPTVTRALGCAIEGFLPFAGSVQLFENGVMYARSGGGFWAIVPGEPGIYRTLEVVSTTPQAPADQTAPPGLILPDSEFIDFWNSDPQLREAIGFAVLPAEVVSLGFQRFEGGILFYEAISGQVFALLVDGSVYGPY